MCYNGFLLSTLFIIIEKLLVLQFLLRGTELEGGNRYDLKILNNEKNLVRSTLMNTKVDK